jgi:hypothetical protein
LDIIGFASQGGAIIPITITVTIVFQEHFYGYREEWLRLDTLWFVLTLAYYVLSRVIVWIYEGFKKWGGQKLGF